MNVIKAESDRRFLLTVVYSPHRMPLRGKDQKIDVVSPEVIEKGAWRYALHGMKVGVGHQPGGEDAFRVVESGIYRGPDWTITGPSGETTTVKAGDWLVGLILSPETWAQFRAGRFTGVSIQGGASRKPASAETLARLKG